MKARDVHDKLKGRIDPVLLDVLAKIAEEQHALARAIPEMAKSFDSLSRVLVQHTQILDNNKDLLEKLKKRVGDVQSISADDPV